MKTEKITFTGHSGDTLAARLDRPVAHPAAYALFAHCFTCSKDIAAARRIAGRLAALDVAVLRFDFTGLGHSGGEFGNTSFTSNVQDLIAAADWMRANLAAPQLIIGHSLGGAAAIAAGAQIAEIKAIATIGAPHDPEHVIHNFGCALDRIEADGKAEVQLAGRPFTIGKQFVDDVRASKLDAALATMKKALLVLHAPLDQTVGIENAGAIFAAARHPKSFVTLDDADHLLSRAEDADYAAEIIAAWSRKYLDLGKAAPQGPADGIVRAAEADPTGFLQDIASGAKHTLADEPKSFGGTDLGFTPYQLVSAGLAACTSMTIRMYARRKKWPLEHVAVDVDHGKIHASACTDCETAEGKIDEFRRAIRITGPDLTAEQRAKLMDIADRCPVHRSLEAEIRVRTEEVA